MDRKLKRVILYRVTALLLGMINILPRRMASFLGEAIGLCASACCVKEAGRAVTNIDRAFGQELSYRRKRRIVREGWINFGRSLMEMMRLRKYYHRQIASGVEIIGHDYLHRAYRRGNGVIAFGGHIGNFELLAAWLAQSGYKIAVIGRELNNQDIDKLLVSNREAMGIVNIKAETSPHTIIRYLRDGYIIGVLIDTDSFRVSGELTPFFGRPAKTPIGPTQLGFVTGAAFLPMFCLSLPGGKHKIIIKPEVVPESNRRSRENVYHQTCRMTGVIEDIIRTYPEQWIWPHNRWHTRPEEDDKRFLTSMGMFV